MCGFLFTYTQFRLCVLLHHNNTTLVMLIHRGFVQVNLLHSTYQLSYMLDGRFFLRHPVQLPFSFIRVTELFVDRLLNIRIMLLIHDYEAPQELFRAMDTDSLVLLYKYHTAFRMLMSNHSTLDEYK